MTREDELLVAKTTTTVDEGRFRFLFVMSYSRAMVKSEFANFSKRLSLFVYFLSIFLRD